ncbi:MAG: apolipoprotein N-acyltransferase [Victivallales bacterium]
MSNDISNIDRTAGELRSAELEKKSERAGNEWWSVSLKRKWIRILLLAGSALLFSAAFPPLNWGFLGWVAIIPLFLMVRNRTVGQAWLDGFIWGYVWIATSFFWLREIELFLPFVTAVVLALFPAFWAAAVPFFNRYIFVPVDVHLKGSDAEREYYSQEKKNNWKQLALVLALAAWWCVLEWARTWIGTGFPWNFLAVTQWKNTPVIQICEFTGVYGLSFLLLFFNISVALSIDTWKNILIKKKYERPLPFLIAIASVMLCVFFGTSSSIRYNNMPDKTKINIAVVQANIPQCRIATDEQAKYALDEYISLSELAVLAKPDLVIWPETAVPIPYNVAGEFGLEYRCRLGKIIAGSRIPFLIGTIDFGKVYGPVLRPEDIPLYNSAILLDANSNIVDTYNKIHLVPWGEFVPGGDLVPQWFKNIFDMGRNLTPGTRYTLFNLNNKVKACVNICFEDVFPEIGRRCALAGANLMIIISNDAWYPTSSEPEQHLAHAVFRAVETRRPIVRGGNNSGTCVIGLNGAIIDSLGERYDERTGKTVLDPMEKKKGFANFSVEVIRDAPLTFYSKYGNVFIYACIVIFIAAFGYSLVCWHEKKQMLLKAFEKK